MKKILTLLAIGIVGLTSCNKSSENVDYNPESMITSESCSVDPDPLKAVGGRVPGTISFTLPAGFVHPDAVVKIQPIMIWDGSSRESDSIVTLVGTNVLEVYGITVGNEVYNGTISFTVDYVPELVNSTLYLNFSIECQGKQWNFRIFVSSGVDAITSI